jgi:hypothetical protein
MSKSQERNLDDMERGHTAGLIHAEFRLLLEEQVGQKLLLLVNHYRAETMSHDFMVGKIGEITAIHDILNELEVRERQGISARQRELG